MPLSEQARERLADVVELQPTKNRELQERWGMESGSEVHQFLESELREYYYRDQDSLIRATAEAEAIVNGEEGELDHLEVRLSPLERDIVDVLPGPQERSRSVVSLLHLLETETGRSTDVGEVRRTLQTLSRRGVVEKVNRTVPTFRLALERSAIEVTAQEEGPPVEGGREQ
ncbi:MAG: DUF5797 family protein [Halodesulfurarchaeum sp.]